MLGKAPGPLKRNEMKRIRFRPGLNLARRRRRLYAGAMNTLTPAEAAAAKSLVALALAEDLGTAGDRTARATIPATAVGRAAFVARANGIVAGLPVAELVLHEVDPQLTFTPLVADGTPATPGKRLAIVAGPMRSALAAERTALNFLQ